ncbi:MAG: type II toxin-antitoxin system RelE/ParE family toxin [Planctomycetales bacterium]|nr:type II toxin-antitoxin system RelE/ParE family toxin [Planctomycetales bacterium]
MARYTVLWMRSAQRELAQLWVASSNRNAIALAANLIDSELTTDAGAKGIEIGEGIRGLFVPPLRILFAVNEQDRKAIVLRVKSL